MHTVEAGKPQGAADNEEKDNRPTDAARALQGPEIQDNCGCHTETDDVRQ